MYSLLHGVIMKIGQNFVNELTEAGLAGLPIAWGENGEVCGRENLTAEQSSALDAVLAAHDPAKVDPLRELTALDAVLPRCVEDLIAAGGISESSLPQVMQERLTRKRHLRGLL